MEESKFNTLDDLVESVKPWGRWQMMLYLLLVPSSVAAFSLTSFFTATNVPHYCQVEELANNNWTALERRLISIPSKARDVAPAVGQIYQPCQYYSELPYRRLASLPFAEALEERDRLLEGDATLGECSQWHFNFTDLPFQSSIVAEWNLVCDTAWIVQLSRSYYQWGYLVGLALGGPLADRFGRRPVVTLTSVLVLIFGTLSAMPFNVNLYLASQVIIAACINANFISGFVMLSEFTTNKTRSKILYAFMAPYCLIYVYLAVFAYLSQEWRIVQGSITLICVPILLTFCLLPESVRWLVQRNRVDEAANVFRRAGRMNSSTGRLPTNLSSVIQRVAGEAKGESLWRTVWSMFRTPEMRKRLVTSYWLWFVNSAVWWGLTWNAMRLYGNTYLIFVLQGFIPLPSLIIDFFLMRRWGCRRPMALSLFLAACSLTAVAVGETLIAADDAKREQYGTTLTVITMFASAFMSSSFNLLFVYTPELFPTTTRAGAVASSSIAARVGGIMSPWAAALSDNVWGPLPLYFYAGVLFVTTVVAWTSTEMSRDDRLCETPEDIEQWRRLKNQDSTALTLGDQSVAKNNKS